MKKRNIIIASLLSMVALGSFTAYEIIKHNNKEEMVQTDKLNLEETDSASDDLFGGNSEVFNAGKISLASNTEDYEILSPVVGKQHYYDSVNNTISIRFFVALKNKNVNVKWTRALYDKDGKESSAFSKNTYTSTKAYSALKYYDYDDGGKEKTYYPSACGDGYTCFALYTIKNIPVSTYSEYTFDARAEISNDYNKEVSKTVSVNTNSTADETAIKVDELSVNNTTLLSSNNSAGNSVYFNNKPKTIYKINEDFSKSNYVAKIGSITNVAPDSYSGFDKTKTGKQIVTLDFGRASTKVNVYVVDTDAYKDSNNVYTVTVNSSYDGVVGAVDGTNGNMFSTISQALEFIQDSSRVPEFSEKKIVVAKGYYKEKLEITTPNLTIEGSGTLAKATYSSAVNYDSDAYSNATIIEYDSLYHVTDVNGFTHETDSTQTVAVRDSAINCKIEGITISNYYNNIARYAGTSYEGSGERGLALLCQADRFQMNNCALLGWQDTAEFFTGRQYIKDSYICGTIDYIFGTNSTTYFDGCTIETIKSKDSYTSDSSVSAYVTAFKGINKDSSDSKEYGAVFNGCTFKNTSDFVGKYALVRPWSEYSNVVVVNSKLEGKAATKESETIATGLINNVNVSTLNVKLYGNKDGSNNDFTLVDDLTNVNTTLAQANVSNYTSYTKSFATTNGFDYAWNPAGNLLIIKNIVFNNTGNYSSLSEVDLSEFTMYENKVDTIGFKGKIKINVNANSLIVINGYSGYVNYTVDGNSASTIEELYYSNDGILVINTGSTASYIKSIVIYEGVESDTFDEDSTIDFSSTAALTAALQNSKITYAEGFTYNDHTDSIQLQSATSSFSFKVKAGATVTVTSFGSGYGYLLIDGVSNNSEVTYTKTYDADATVTIAAENSEATGGWSNSYLKKIEITYPKVIENDLTISFATGGNGYSSIDGVTNTCTVTDNNGDGSAQIKNGTITLMLKSAATITIVGNWHIDFTISGNKVINYGDNPTHDSTTYVYDAPSAGNVSIVVGNTGNNYFKSIIVKYKTVINSNTQMNFGTSGNYSSLSGFDITATVSDNGENNSQVKNGNIVFTVASGATVEIYGNYSVDFQVNDNDIIKGYTAESGNNTDMDYLNQAKFTYTFTTETEVTVKCISGVNYFYWIKITF